MDHSKAFKRRLASQFMHAMQNGTLASLEYARRFVAVQRWLVLVQTFKAIATELHHDSIVLTPIEGRLTEIERLKIESKHRVVSISVPPLPGLLNELSYNSRFVDIRRTIIQYLTAIYHSVFLDFFRCTFRKAIFLLGRFEPPLAQLRNHLKV